MSIISRIFGYALTDMLTFVGIILLVTIIFWIILWKVIKPRLLVTLIAVTLIILVILITIYNNAVMPSELETDEINTLESMLVEKYPTVRSMKVIDNGGTELTFLVSINDDISVDLYTEILNHIRNMLNGEAFMKDIEEYYWSEYFSQHSIEVKFLQKEEALITFYAHRGVNSTNLELYQWDGYNHLTDEKIEFQLEY